MRCRSRKSSGIVSVERDKEFKSGVKNPFQGVNDGSDRCSAFTNVYLSIAAAWAKVVLVVRILDGKRSTKVGVGVDDAHTFAECNDTDFGLEHIA